MANVPINLDEFKRAIAERDGIEIQAGDRTFMVRPVELLSDDEVAQLMAADDGDELAQAKLLVDDYDGFAAAGGSAMLLVAILKEQGERQRAEQGATPGESEASSSS